jgi:hypothetical protein
MPYTAEKADQAMGLQLKLLGLKPDKSKDAAADKPPILDAGIDREKYKRQVAKDLIQAVNEVAAVYFCRLKEANPSKSEALIDAQIAFTEDLDLVIDPDHYKDASTTQALSNTLKSRCKAQGCPEVPRVLAANELGKVAKSENFTKVEITKTNLYANIRKIAEANGCWSVVNASILSVPGAYLGALEGVAPVLSDYLQGGKMQILGLTTLRIHAKAALKAAGQQREDVSDVVKKDDKIGSCLAKVTKVPDPNDPAPAAKEDKKEGAAEKDEPKVDDAKIAVTVGDKTVTLKAEDKAEDKAPKQ